jgi:arogenate dehydrogenase (NADP+)
VGFGNFGQFLAKRFIANGHDVIATSRGDYHKVADDLGVGYYRDPDDFCEMHPDVVIFWQGNANGGHVFVCVFV